MILEIIHTIQKEIEKQRKNGRFTTAEPEPSEYRPDSGGSIEIPTGRITVLCIHIMLTTFLQAIDKALPYIIAILAYKHL